MKRTEENYESQKKMALEFGRNPPFKGRIDASDEKLGLNSEGRLDKVLFGTCDTCDHYYAENILPIPGMDVDGERKPCDDDDCDGTVTQIHLVVE